MMLINYMRVKRKIKNERAREHAQDDLSHARIYTTEARFDGLLE